MNLHAAVALLPIAVLIFALGIVRLPAHRVTPLAWILAVVLAAFLWDAPPARLVGASLEGAALAVWPILLVVLAAIHTFNLVAATGGLATLREGLAAVSDDRRIQVLVLAWGFGGFLEAVAGYGTAVAIPASILAALGFDPFFAAVVCLVANTVATAFGAVGIPVTTLASLTGLPEQPLGMAIALQLSPLVLLVPFVLVAMTGSPREACPRPLGAQAPNGTGVRALRGVVGVTFATGAAFVAGQLVALRFLGPELAALAGSVASLATTVALARPRPMGARRGAPRTGRTAPTPSELARAALPYLLVVAAIVATSPLVPPLHAALAPLRSTISFVEGAPAQTFRWPTPGLLILVAASAGALLQGLPLRLVLSTFIRTLRQMAPAAATVVALLAMARVMSHSGMIGELAGLVVAATGGLYPLVAPAVGALGTFLTGSDTSSNILFGRLQVEVASSLGLDPVWLAAANTAGATAGKMISPQSIAVATSATGLTGADGALLRRTLGFCVVYVALLGLLVWLGSRVAAP